MLCDLTCYTYRWGGGGGGVIIECLPFDLRFWLLCGIVTVVVSYTCRPSCPFACLCFPLTTMIMHWLHRMMRLCRMDFSQKFIGHGYKELEIPPAPGGGFRLPNPNCLHIWPCQEFMLSTLASL